MKKAVMAHILAATLVVTVVLAAPVSAREFNLTAAGCSLLRDTNQLIERVIKEPEKSHKLHSKATNNQKRKCVYVSLKPAHAQYLWEHKALKKTWITPADSNGIAYVIKVVVYRDHGGRTLYVYLAAKTKFE